VLAAVLAALQWNGVVLATPDIRQLPLLAQRGDIRREFDLLGLGGKESVAAWNLLASLKPRAVACSGPLRAALAPVAARLGYANIWSEPQDGDTLWLRDDLVEAAAFNQAP
jgi:hypothetical protein